MQSNATQGSTPQASAVQGSTPQGGAAPGRAPQGRATQGSAAHSSAVKASAEQGSAVQGSAEQGSAEQCTAVQGSAVQVRRATETDAARLADLAAATFPLACPPDAPAADIEAFVAGNLTAERFTDYVTDARRTVLVAEDGDVLIGYAMLIFGEQPDPAVAAQLTIRPSAELSKIYVAAEHHGSGTARALLAAALKDALGRGTAGVWLGTNRQNVRAQRFYVKSGFARVGTKRFQLGERIEDDYVLEYVFS